MSTTITKPNFAASSHKSMLTLWLQVCFSDQQESWREVHLLPTSSPHLAALLWTPAACNWLDITVYRVLSSSVYREVSEIVFLSIVVEQNGWVCTLFCLDAHKAVDHNPALLVCLELLGWDLQLQQQLHLHDGQPPALHIHHGAWHCSTRPTAAPQSLAAGRYLRAHHSSALNDS